jgi:hypothetical protein
MKASEAEIRAAINSVKKNLHDSSLLYDWNNSTLVRISNRRNRITWATSGVRPEISSFPISNVGEYLLFLEGRHYQFLLIDGSLIQMSYDFNRAGEIKNSRLVWYPCPVQFTPEELEYESIKELVVTAPTETIACRSPIRLDFSPDQISQNHSSTHIHLGMEEFRLPVHRAMEPSRFIRFIIRTVYPNIWDTYTEFRKCEDWAAQDVLNNDDRLYGYLGWHPPIPSSN